MIRIAYQGMKDSNSERAAQTLVKQLNLDNVEYIPALTSKNVKNALLSGGADFGVVATKNVNTGIVEETEIAFTDFDYQILSTCGLEIEHYLYTTDDTTKIKIIASHPQAIAQCQNTLKTDYPNVQLLDLEDTAIGAKHLHEGLLAPNTAVLCSKNAGEYFNLKLVRSHLQDNRNNTTEFMIVALNKKTKIGISGLGLIGGSIAKAFKKFTNFKVLGSDPVDIVESMALESRAIDSILTDEELSDIDILIVGLYPQQTIEYLLKVLPKMKKGAIAIDLAGVKTSVIDAVESTAKQHGIIFVGGHPMAGLAHGGFQNSFADLFQNASMIFVPTDNKYNIDYISNIFLNLGFGSIKITDKLHHDKMIAHTSQLAHIVSNSYVKSRYSDDTEGFCGGSYQDMTRVAPMNEKLWKELFLLNKDVLIDEIDELISNITTMRNHLVDSDEVNLEATIKEGRLRKEHIDKNNTIEK